MLLIAAGSIQALLLSEMVLRRALLLICPSKRNALQRFADTSALSSFACFCLNAITVPLQAIASIVNTIGRFWVLMAFACVFFSALMTLSGSSVYAYTVLARMYNYGVVPFVTAGQWLFVLLDFVNRAIVPVWNGLLFFVKEILWGIILPFSFQNIEILPEIMQAMTLTLLSLASSIATFLQNIKECTLAYEPISRVCGDVGSSSSFKNDCSSVFTPTYTQCFAGPNHMSLDLLTPGLFMRQAAVSLRRVITTHCSVAAVVLNLLLFPFAELHLYAAVHGAVNAVIFAVLGLPITTVRRCQALSRTDLGVAGLDNDNLSTVQRIIACSPDWQPLVSMVTSALESFGELVNNWLNACSLLVHESLGMSENKAERCEESVRMNSIVLDAARAIEGFESVAALERLEGRGGLPDSATLLRVRVVGVTPRLFGVTDGRAVLYRGAHDGYVWAYGAWPFAVDVRLGLAAVSYDGSAAETDGTGDARTGLFGCTCIDGPDGFQVLCATAPYLQHIDNDIDKDGSESADTGEDFAGTHQSTKFSTDTTHLVSFPDLSLLGMTCKNTAVRVFPLRWPRKRIARTSSSNYERYSYADLGKNIQGDREASDNLNLLSSKLQSTPAGAVEAAIFVQPLCGQSSVACALAADNCFPWCMGVVKGGPRAQNISMFNTARWETHVLLPDVDCGVSRQHSARAVGDCETGQEGVSIVDISTRVGVVGTNCKAEKMCTPSPVPALVSSLVSLSSLQTTNNTELGLVKEHKRNKWLGVRMEQQPFVVAGDVLLSVEAEQKVVIVTRLYDVGHGSFQLLNERLTLSSNAHSIEIADCETLGDKQCVETAMSEGKLVLPVAFYTMENGRLPQEHADGGEVT